MKTRSARMACCALVLIIASTTAAFGELPPSAYKRMQDEAPEHLQIKVLSVKTREMRDEIEVFAEAIVTAVIRSTSELKVGDAIRIEYFHSTRRAPGPSPVPILVQDQSYQAFLECYSKRDKTYNSAAGGRSFPEVP